ncbi:MAG: phage holin family protein [Rhodoferax sp.]|nr:phage holin family protein [Rhodoferax sp.]
MHPLFHLIATRPQLLFEHLESYAELVGAEMGIVTERWKRSVILNVVALCLLIVGVGLAGVALMLWAVVPGSQMQATWALIAVPLPPLVIAAGCLLAARGSSETRAFDHLRRQVSEDMAMLREAD